MVVFPHDPAVQHYWRENLPWKRVHITWKRMVGKTSISFWDGLCFGGGVWYDPLYQDHISLHLHTPRPEVMTGASTGRTSDRDGQVEIARKPQECCWFRWKVKGCQPLKLDQAFLKVFWGALRILTPSYWKPSKHQTLIVTPIGSQKQVFLTPHDIWRILRVMLQAWVNTPFFPP